MKKLISAFWADTHAATAIEYSLIAGMIGMVIILAVTTVGTGVSKQFSKVASAMN